MNYLEFMSQQLNRVWPTIEIFEIPHSRFLFLAIQWFQLQDSRMLVVPTLFLRTHRRNTKEDRDSTCRRQTSEGFSLAVHSGDLDTNSHHDASTLASSRPSGRCLHPIFAAYLRGPHRLLTSHKYDGGNDRNGYFRSCVPV